MLKDCAKYAKGLGLFGAGVLFGTAGIKILGSKDAKKVYTNVVAAGLRGKECVMAATKVQENAEDVLAEAKEINRQREEEQKQEEVE